MRKKRLPHSTIMMVEGKDDAGLVEALLHWLELGGVHIIAIHGSSNFKDALRALAGYDVEALGLIRDADDRRSSAFQSLQSSLRNAGFPAPSVDNQFTTANPRVGILINPPVGLGTDRALEDVLYASVQSPEMDAAVATYIAFFEEQGIELRDLDLTKARIHAVLNAHDVPGLTIAEAAAKGLWDFAHPAFNELRTFLQQLVNKA